MSICWCFANEYARIFSVGGIFGESGETGGYSCRTEKEGEFRREYRNLTGELLSLPGDRVPFYVWKPETNKWGIQRRVYGDRDAAPALPNGVEIREGRIRDGEHWRINHKGFISELFKYELATTPIGRTKFGRVSPKRICAVLRRDFPSCPADRAELLLREQCEMRISPFPKSGGHGKIRTVIYAALILGTRKILKTNAKENALTYIPQAGAQANEIESAEMIVRECARKTGIFGGNIRP